eukprot:TRINITY_DN55841_c0_g1_i1.p1 TRINITY_DN55841_c0_g1~~TRINITY_DN55841_c0_g1_i1.p1  ORF type:complete len:164 (-),score=15.76 TRINITY_DN55841_c0_g1_i1:136-627(-)
MSAVNEHGDTTIGQHLRTFERMLSAYVACHVSGFVIFPACTAPQLQPQNHVLQVKPVAAPAAFVLARVDTLQPLGFKQPVLGLRCTPELKCSLQAEAMLKLCIGTAPFTTWDEQVLLPIMWRTNSNRPDFLVQNRHRLDGKAEQDAQKLAIAARSTKSLFSFF